jgi:hypothetical protein
MNFFVEGLQGSGKSTLVGKLSEKYPDYKAYHEGDYCPVELAWCSYVSPEQYAQILEKYPSLRVEIEKNSFEEEGRVVICYTRIITDVPGFHKDLEQYEMYNNRVSREEFRRILLSRYGRWTGEREIFECSLFQNTVEDMILFQLASDEEILDFYREIRKSLEGKQYRILYLKAEDVAANLAVIRKERSDDDGNELWFPLMMEYFNSCPYAEKHGVSGEEGLLDHLRNRQELELRICREVFPEESVILTSKGYDEQALDGLE